LALAPTTQKGPEAFRTISEASAEVGAPQHVLRFWETRFSFIRPMKRAGGRRFYRPQDIEVLRGVRVLLQDEGYTIKGVQRLHREQGLRRIVAAARGEAVPPPLAEDLEGEGDPPLISVAAVARLEALLADIERAKADLDALLTARASE
jgi:DNA-binding transcriptional MerR regulator